MKKTMILSKRQSFIILKVIVFISIFGLYLVVLIKESIHVMENGKTKTGPSKFDNAAKQYTPPEFHRNKHNAPQIQKLQIHHQFHNFQSIDQTPYNLAVTKSNPIKSSADKSVLEVGEEQSKRKSSDPGGGISTANPIYEYSEEINAQAERDFNERRDNLWKVCQKRQIIGKMSPNAWEFFLSPGHGLAWCTVYKAASSAWMYYFNILAGYDIKYLQRTVASPLELARKRFPRPSLEDLYEALETSLSFLIVREPFERLLSAYRNKIEGCKNTYYKLLGEQIVKRFRKKTLSKTDPSGPTFREFLEFVIKHYQSGGRFDEHWSPIYQFCTPCSINFTLIAKVETFKRDTEYIVRQAGLETLLLNKVPKYRESQISNRSRLKTKKLIPLYFSQIDEDLLKQILEIYQLDFELFGYNSTVYYNYVKPSSTTATSSVASSGANNRRKRTNHKSSKKLSNHHNF